MCLPVPGVLPILSMFSHTAMSLPSDMRTKEPQANENPDPHLEFCCCSGNQGFWSFQGTVMTATVSLCQFSLAVTYLPNVGSVASVQRGHASCKGLHPQSLPRWTAVLCETSNRDSLTHPVLLLNLMLRTHFQSILPISLLANTVACPLPLWDGLLIDQEHDLSPLSTPRGVCILELLEKRWTRKWNPNCLVCSVIRYLETLIACQVHLTCYSRISWEPLRVLLEIRSLKMSLNSRP